MIQSSADRRMRGFLGAAGCSLLYLLAARLAESCLLFWEAEVSLGPVGRERLHWGGLAAITLLAALPALAAARRILGRLPGLGWPRRGILLPVLLYLSTATVLARLAEALPGSTVTMTLPADSVARGLAFFQLCILSAGAEELVFRSGIQGLLAPWGRGISVMGQALVFASLHGSPAQMAFALPMGLLFGWTAWRCHSIWPGAALHLVNNIIVFAGLLAGS